MSLFLLTFFLVYGGTHAYALYKAQTAFGFGWKTLLAAAPVLAALLCGPLIVYFFSVRGMEGASRWVSWIAYVWMGLLFFFTWTNLALDGANLAARAASAVFGNTPKGLIVYGRPAFLSLAALSVVLGFYSFLEASHLRTEHLRIETEKLPAAARRIRIAQISDVHLGLMVRHRRARAIAEAIRDAKPDLVVSTGDLVDGRINHLDGLSGILRDIPAPLGKYAVTGNHEFYAGIGPSLDFTRRAGFTVLRGQDAPVGNALRLVGVDDPAAGSFVPREGRSEEELMGSGPSPRFTILLKHRPVLSPAARTAADLQLSGHTHNGQIFPFRLLVRLFYPLLSGLYESKGGAALYTSRGTGTWGPPMRFLASPEVTIIDIERPPDRL
ncbi:MAG: metallophosphoesterase [Deltaproteobacteria bacterium]|nr:MAG: metallophosphoesterase [Deltaproteobacteria bacterium]